MKKKPICWFITLLGTAIGAGIGSLLGDYLNQLFPPLAELTWTAPAIIILFAIISAVLSYSRHEHLVQRLQKISDRSISLSKKTSTKTLTLGAAALVASLLIAFLLTQLLDFIPSATLRGSLTVLLYIVCVYCGIRLTMARQDDIIRFFTSKAHAQHAEEEKTAAIGEKLLDTSVIIDGRIFDVCDVGFLEGKIIIPIFVLKELQFIADCPDAIKRGRGRRGLELIGKFRENHNVEISNEDFAETDAVDDKLVLLAKKRGSTIITNDYNLNQVARVQGITVLNVNDLANALKPALIPGEALDVQLIKEGKELGQAVGYLADGTMVVVDEAADYITHQVHVEVTSMLQTSAGRLIFAKLAE